MDEKVRRERESERAADEKKKRLFFLRSDCLAHFTFFSLKITFASFASR
jgi:hypothetical protein